MSFNTLPSALNSLSIDPNIAQADPFANVPPTPLAQGFARVSGPKFGGFFGQSYAFPWMGGKPTSDYSGTTLSAPKSVNATIPTDPSKYIKIYDGKVGANFKRTFDPKNLDYPLQAFAIDLWRHLESYGLDTCFYFQDAATGDLLDIINHYPRFTKEFVASEMLKASRPNGHYGDCSYALSALEDSGTLIYNLSSLDLQLRLQSCMSDPRLGSSGPVLWMCIVESLQSNSHMVFKQKALDLEKITLSQFDGENIDQYVDHMRRQIIILRNARRLPVDINLTILNTLIGSSVEQFRFNFYNSRTKENMFLTRTFGMSSTDVEQLYDYVDPMAYLDQASQVYHQLLDTNGWGPNKVVGVNTAGISQQNGGKLTRGRPDAQSTEQKSTDPNDKPDSNSNVPASPNSSTTNSRNNSGRRQSRDRQANASPWKSVPPAAGQSPIKSVSNRMYHWCAKCNYWRVGHDTASHKDLPPRSNTVNTVSGNLARLAVDDQDDHLLWGMF
jgi:hypothetical protein